MKIINVEQGSQEWLELRRGVVTASRFKDVIAPSTLKVSASSKKYLYELVAEALGAYEEIPQTLWMQRGNELEDEARKTFEFITGLCVKQVGFVLHDSETIGVSPDGLIGDNSGLEIKCPKASTHIKYLLDGKLPTEYKLQVMGNMWVTERDTWWFMSYHPDLKPFIIEVKRDDEYIAKMSKELLDFATSINEYIEKVA